jgi:hypothetical protein
MVSLHFMHYNFCRQHKSLRGVAPAMEAKVTDRLWSIDDIVDLVDAQAESPKHHQATVKGRDKFRTYDFARIHKTLRVPIERHEDLRSGALLVG